MKKLERLLKEIDLNIPLFERKDLKISNASIGWQLEHVMLVMNSIIKAIEVSEPADYNYKWKLNRSIVMTMGNIPRGKAKAPHRVQPTDEFDEVTLLDHLEKTRLNVKKLKTLNKNQFFPHPIFGNMKLKSATKFLAIHTKHHLSIVKDILR